jgi:hypothetical protein
MATELNPFKGKVLSGMTEKLKRGITLVDIMRL